MSGVGEYLLDALDALGTEFEKPEASPEGEAAADLARRTLAFRQFAIVNGGPIAILEMLRDGADFGADMVDGDPAGISSELEEGIRTYAARIAALGGYGARVRAPVGGGRVYGRKCSCGVDCTCPEERHPTTFREGQLVELGFGGCQPGILADDGKRYAISTLSGVVALHV